MKRKTPDQIRRETIPAHHYGLIYGFLSAVIAGSICFGGWGLTHREQVRRYPEYIRHALRAQMEGMRLFGATKHRDEMSAEALRYALLRFGNRDHSLDSEIIRHGWYPRGVNPNAWVYNNGNIDAVFSDPPAMVFRWPLAFTSLAFLICLVAGLVRDFRYRAAIIAGIPFEGSLVSTVAEYNGEVQGDGMGYVVKPWKDR